MKSFFDYSNKEKKAILHEAAVESNKAQKELTNTMEWKTFEEWLQYKHSEWHPELLDDDLPDAYGDWVAGLSEDEWIDYGNRFAKEQLKAQALSYKKRIEGLRKKYQRPMAKEVSKRVYDCDVTAWNDALAHVIQEMEKND
jgi:hypothetical protein